MPTEIENTSQLYFTQKLYVWSPDHLLKPQHKNLKRPKKLQANLLISCSILKVLTYANRNKIRKSFWSCSYRVDLIRAALRALSQSVPLLLEADLARTELLTLKLHTPHFKTAGGVTKIFLRRWVLIFSYMPGIPPKLNPLWRFIVNSVSHFFRQQYAIVGQMVLTTCFAGHVSLEPCMSTHHVTFFCADKFGFIVISASLYSTSVVVSCSLISYSFVRIFVRRIFSQTVVVWEGAISYVVLSEVNRYTIDCLRVSDFYCLPSAWAILIRLRRDLFCPSTLPFA